MAISKPGKEFLLIKKDNGKDSVVLDFRKLNKSILILRAINHPLRQTILTMLDRRREMIVTEIYSKLELEQSVVSQHLAILRKSEVVIATRKGKFIYYSVNKKRFAEIVSFVEELAFEK